jgi:hypothetical protein
VFYGHAYGAVDALFALFVMGAAFGYGFPCDRQPRRVIVSHVIVLFDFIEEMHEVGL